MPCNGLGADTYDLYVLGLLDGKELDELERHLARRCSVCLRNIQKALNLWLVFASTLEDAEPSADVRSRLVRIAELNKKVLTLPARPVAARHFGSHRLWTGAAAVGVAAILVIGAYFAGHQAGSIEGQRLTRELSQLTREVATTQVLLDEAQTRERAAEDALKSSGDHTVLLQQSQMRKKLLELEAEVNQYKAVLTRQEIQVTQNSRILDVLTTPGVRLVPIRGLDIADKSTAYALIQEPSRLLFVASNLPELSSDRQFQLWLLRKQDPKVVSGGAFQAQEDRRAVVSFDDPTAVNDFSEIAVTEEPKDGSNGGTPSGTKLLSGSILANNERDSK